MKVLLTTGIYPPDIGGPATYIPQLASDITEYVDHVSIVTLGPKNEVVKQDKIKIIKIKRTYPLPMRLFVTSVCIFRELLKSQAIFSNGLFFESAVALAFLKNKKSVVKIVGDPIWEKLRNNGLTNLNLTDYITHEITRKKSLLRKLYNWSWSRFKYKTCPSQELCQMVNKFLGINDCVHIPNGIEIGSYPSGHQDFDLVTVSRLVSWKNLDIVIKVASELNLKLLIIGSGPEEIRLRELARISNCKVKFAGQVSPDLAKQLMATAKIFIQISDYEGLSFSLLEAMGLGLVPIVSNVNGNTSVVSDKENGVVVDISETALLKAVEEIKTDHVLAEKLSLNARDTVEAKYNGKKQRKLMIELISR